MVDYILALVLNNLKDVIILKSNIKASLWAYVLM